MCKKDCDYINYLKTLIWKQELSVDKNGYFEGGKYLKVDEEYGFAYGNDVFKKNMVRDHDTNVMNIRNPEVTLLLPKTHC